jgi:GNAT superfamily N-acetyltransferase
MELLDPQLLQFMIEDMLPGQYVTEEQYAPGCAVDWYFGAMLGVDPKAQSYGVGGKIMTEIIKRAGDVPVAFHTQGSKNVSGVGGQWRKRPGASTQLPWLGEGGAGSRGGVVSGAAEVGGT